MRELLETYFRTMLNSLGYNMAELGYSLSYCQGDGVCFYNCEIDLDKVIDRIYSIEHISSKQQFLDLKAKHILKSGVLEYVDFTVHHDKGRYFHHNSVDVHYDYHNDIEEILELGFWEDEDDFVAFIEDVQTQIGDDVTSICRLMECHGYALIEACGPNSFDDKETVFTWETSKYVLTVEEIKPDFDDLGMDFSDVDTIGYFIESSLSMIDGKTRRSDFKATVFELPEDWDSEFDEISDCEELESLYWSSNEYFSGDSTKSGILNEIIIQVLGVAGETLNHKENAATLAVAA